MKISHRWLSELIDLKKIDPQEIGDKLTLHTCELEELISKKDFFKKILTGKILSIKVHPKTENLMIGEIDLGPQGKFKIIYGAALKVKKDWIVPIAIPGAILPIGITIEEREMKGEKSQGMICINSELGHKNDNLTVFPNTTKLGIPISEAIPEFGDIIFDIDNKSLTHRPDLWGHEGFARELGAIFNKKFQIIDPKTKLLNTKNSIKIDIKTDKCRRFATLKMSELKNIPSDIQTQIRLENLGIRAISNLVDVTNIVLLELGQPMHVFDADKIEGTLIIRQAKNGEKIIALDGEEYELTSDDTVVADEKKILSIAGIMGGEHSGVTETTTNIIIESANWDPVSIRKTSTRLGLRSDSSIRYEKSLDPENCIRSLLLAVKYLQKSCPTAKIETTIIDNYSHKNKELKLSLCPNKVRTVAGINISDKEISKILESIGFHVSQKEKHIDVLVPSFRATKDIEIEEDLIEEIIRLYGFDRIPSILPTLPMIAPKENLLRNLEWKIRDFFSSRKFMETFNYSFVGNEDQDSYEEGEYVKLENPLSEDQSLLRITLLSNILKNIESELRTHERIDLFEIGKIYEKTLKVLPNEIAHLALFSAEIGGNENKKFFELKDDLSLFFKFLNLDARFLPMEKIISVAHPSKCANIFIEDKYIGNIFVIHPTKNLIRNATMVFAEINIETLQKLAKHHRKYKKISPFPAIYRDLSIILNKKSLMGEVENEIVRVSENLQSIKLFDEFEDKEKFGSDLKNIAFHLTFRSHKKTLEEKEIDENFNKIVKTLEQKFKAKLRIEFDKNR